MHVEVARLFVLSDRRLARHQSPIRRIQRDVRADGEGGIDRHMTEREIHHQRNFERQVLDDYSQSHSLNKLLIG